MKTLQQEYQLIKEGKGNKDHFLKVARHLFPDYITSGNDFTSAVRILTSKSLLSEAAGGVVTTGRKDWWAIFDANLKEAVGVKNTKEYGDQNDLNVFILWNLSLPYRLFNSYSIVGLQEICDFLMFIIHCFFYCFSFPIFVIPVWSVATVSHYLRGANCKCNVCRKEGTEYLAGILLFSCRVQPLTSNRRSIINLLDIKHDLEYL